MVLGSTQQGIASSLRPFHRRRSRPRSDILKKPEYNGHGSPCDSSPADQRGCGLSFLVSSGCQSILRTLTCFVGLRVLSLTGSEFWSARPRGPLQQGLAPRNRLWTTRPSNRPRHYIHASEL